MAFFSFLEVLLTYFQIWKIKMENRCTFQVSISDCNIEKDGRKPRCLLLQALLKNSLLQHGAKIVPGDMMSCNPNTSCGSLLPELYEIHLFIYNFLLKRALLCCRTILSIKYCMTVYYPHPGSLHLLQFYNVVLHF